MSTLGDGSAANVKHLLVPDNGMCWWCETRQATTREHKYKKSDLRRLQSGDGLLWGSGGEVKRSIRGINRSKPPLVFRKSLCAVCNNERSQPFDRAYTEFADWVVRRKFMRTAGIDFRRIYGDDWGASQERMARYYAKHFGCRMVEIGIPVPGSLRRFLDSGTPMSDAHLGLVLNDQFHQDRRYRDGLILSGDLVYTDPAFTNITGIVQAAFLGPVGVRYQWWAEPPEGLDSFLGHPMPILNRFRTEQEVLTGTPVQLRPAARVKQAIGWVRDRRWRQVFRDRDSG